MTQLGKYSTDRDNILHYMATSDWANASFGDVESPVGYVWRMTNTPEDVQLSNTELTSLIEDQVKLYAIEDGPAFRESLVGHWLIQEDSNGLVSVQDYAILAELVNVYDALESEYSAWVGDDDD